MTDRACDTNAIRQQIQSQGAVPNIPPKRNRLWKSCFSPFLYRGRNAIERMFCRLKDFRDAWQGRRHVTVLHMAGRPDGEPRQESLAVGPVPTPAHPSR
jgi:hypothetical protein